MVRGRRVVAATLLGVTGWLAGSGSADVSAQAGGSHHQKATEQLCFKIVIEKGTPVPLAPTARDALDDAIHRRPASVFATEPLNAPPPGHWVADYRETNPWQTRFDHVSDGRTDWTAYVFRSDESGYEMKPRRGWYYGGGGPGDFPVQKTNSICPFDGG
jgi:hypothetical protein